MGQLFGSGSYQIKRGDGTTGFPFKPETTTVPAGGYSESLAINAANQIDIAITFTALAAGSVEVQRSSTFDFAAYEVLDSFTLPSSGTIASFNYPGNSASSFLRLFNNTNLSITAQLQQNV